MRIVVNDLAASQTGAIAVVRSFYDFICKTDHDNEWVFLLSGDYLQSKENIRIVVIPDVKKSWLHKLRFDFVTGWKVIEKFHPDYVLSMQNIITFGVRQRQGVYIHQSIPFQDTKRFSFLKRDEFIYAIYQYLIGWIIKLSARKADDVYVQTKWMKKAVSEKVRIAAEKITVVPVEAGKFENTGVELKKNRFFYPAGFEAVYKNHDCIYKACDMLDQEGIGDYSVVITLDASKKPVSRQIQFVGRLNKEQMQEEYQKSVLIFPSYIETVGLPLIEAAQVGAKIIVADCEYAHEALDGYDNVLFFDPMNPKELSFLLRQIIESKETHKSKYRINQNHTWQALIEKINATIKTTK